MVNFRCPAHAHENWKGGVERGGGVESRDPTTYMRGIKTQTRLSKHRPVFTGRLSCAEDIIRMLLNE